MRGAILTATLFFSVVNYFMHAETCAVEGTYENSKGLGGNLIRLSNGNEVEFASWDDTFLKIRFRRVGFYEIKGDSVFIEYSFKKRQNERYEKSFGVLFHLRRADDIVALISDHKLREWPRELDDFNSSYGRFKGNPQFTKEVFSSAVGCGFSRGIFTRVCDD